MSCISAWALVGSIAEGCSSVCANSLKGDSLKVFLVSCGLTSPWSDVSQHCKPESPHISEAFLLLSCSTFLLWFHPCCVIWKCLHLMEVTQHKQITHMKVWVSNCASKCLIFFSLLLRGKPVRIYQNQTQHWQD